MGSGSRVPWSSENGLLSGMGMVAGAGEVAQMTWHLGVQPEGRISLPSGEVRKGVPDKGVSRGSGSGGAQRVSGLGVV